MKKTNFLKIAFTLVLAFLITGVFAQSTNVPGTAAQYDETVTSTYMMAGSTVPLYAQPDAYYHNSYDPDVAGTLTAGFTWTWSVTAGTATDLTFSQNAAPDNYVALTAIPAALGAYTVNVIEKAPAALGGCDDGAGTNLTINVVAAPSVTIGGDATYSFCAGGAFPANIQSIISGGWQNYRMTWSLEIATLNAASAKEFYYSNELGAGQNAVQFYAVNYTEAAPQDIANPAAAPDLMTVGSFAVIDNNGAAAGGNAVTVYTYVLNKINDQASRFGQFITKGGVVGTDDTFTYYPIVDAPETVVVTVYPSPVTGPIFHIDHTWSN